MGTDSADELQGLAGKRFLITGARGMLGTAFDEVLAARVPSASVVALHHDVLDVCRRDQVARCVDIRPDYIVHCAVKSDVNWCEDHADEAAAVQVDGTAHIAQLARDCGAQVLFPQSFLVHDGTETVDESTRPRPLSAYGNLKFEAERVLLAAVPDALTITMGGFFGNHVADKNFVGKFVLHLAGLLKSGARQLEIGDRVWQPTLTSDLAYNSLLLLAQGKTGRFCMASHGQASFFDLAREIVHLLGIDDRMEIVRVSAESMARKEKAVRPGAVVMRNAAMQACGLDRQRSWQASLADYLAHPYFKAVLT